MADKIKLTPAQDKAITELFRTVQRGESTWAFAVTNRDNQVWYVTQNLSGITMPTLNKLAQHGLIEQRNGAGYLIRLTDAGRHYVNGGNDAIVVCEKCGTLYDNTELGFFFPEGDDENMPERFTERHYCDDCGGEIAEKYGWNTPPAMGGGADPVPAPAVVKLSKLSAKQHEILSAMVEGKKLYHMDRVTGDWYALDWRRVNGNTVNSLVKRGFLRIGRYEVGEFQTQYHLTDAGRAALATTNAKRDTAFAAVDAMLERIDKEADVEPSTLSALIVDDPLHVEAVQYQTYREEQLSKLLRPLSFGEWVAIVTPPAPPSADAAAVSAGDTKTVTVVEAYKSKLWKTGTLTMDNHPERWVLAINRIDHMTMFEVVFSDGARIGYIGGRLMRYFAAAAVTPDADGERYEPADHYERGYMDAINAVNRRGGDHYEQFAKAVCEVLGLDYATNSGSFVILNAIRALQSERDAIAADLAAAQATIATLTGEREAYHRHMFSIYHVAESALRAGGFIEPVQFRNMNEIFEHAFAALGLSPDNPTPTPDPAPDGGTGGGADVYPDDEPDSVDDDVMGAVLVGTGPKAHTEAAFIGSFEDAPQPRLVAAPDLVAGDRIYDANVRTFVEVLRVEPYRSPRGESLLKVYTYHDGGHPISRNRNQIVRPERKFETKRIA